MNSSEDKRLLQLEHKKKLVEKIRADALIKANSERRIAFSQNKKVKSEQSVKNVLHNHMYQDS